jgi:hypothetical protein
VLADREVDPAQDDVVPERLDDPAQVEDGRAHSA